MGIRGRIVGRRHHDVASALSGAGEGRDKYNNRRMEGVEERNRLVARPVQYIGQIGAACRAAHRQGYGRWHEDGR